MDIQTKVLFIIGKSSNQTVKELFIDEKKYPDFFLGEEFIVFPEHAPVAVQLVSNHPASYITLETYDKEDLVKIYPNGEKYIISPGGESESMIVPGYYGINIYIADQIYHGFYKVEPSTISWEGLMKLRDFLESLMNGLAQNLYWRKMGKQADYVSQNPGLLEMYEHIVNNERMLINNIESLIKNPITNITKKYMEQSYSKASDIKSQKWLSKKGITINSNAYIPEVNYEKHSVLDINTAENRWIRKILHHTVYTVVELERAYSRIQERINQEIDEKNIEYNKALVKYEDVKNQKYLTKRYKYQQEARVKVLENDIKSYYKKRDVIQEYLQNLKRIKAVIAHYEYQTWLSRIEDYNKVFKPTLKLLKEPRCFQVYTFYKKLFLMQKNRYGRKISFPFKKTSLLFEYYSVVVVINILESLGYEWKKGWLVDNVDPMIFNGELPKETVMVFQKDNLYLEIIYDKEVSSEPDNSKKDQIVNINSIHTRPDIKITLFNNNTGKLLGCIIIEVKCSKSKYIYDGNGDTKSIEQIRDYLNFGHYDAIEEKCSTGGVNKVILVYPKQKFSVQYPKYNFAFIQLDPVNEKNGCEELKREFERLLDQYENEI